MVCTVISRRLWWDIHRLFLWYSFRMRPKPLRYALVVVLYGNKGME